jgi:TolB-like protein
MRCPRCRSDNSDTSRFCVNCAEPLRPSGPDPGIPTKTITAQVGAVPKGSVVGKYRVIDEIGRGGMGVVYRAEDTRLKRTVALKFLSPELTSDPEARQRFIQEAQAASALEHPNICNIHEIDETEDGRMFMAMACYEGQSLRERLRQGKMDRGEALSMAVQTARGLAKAHEKGIVHRDVKPANMFITSDGTVKILDFGLAKLTADIRLTRTGTTVGTIAYMSPEQAEGRAVDGRTDVWSLGVMFYEMLTGELPFGGEHEGSLLNSILRKPPRPLRKADPAVSPELERVVLKALEKIPADRYRTMTDFLADLEALAEGQKPAGAKSGLLRGRILGFKKPVFYGGLVVTVAIVLAVIVILTGGSKVYDSIAILPVINEKGDAEWDYFAEGLTRELNTELYKVAALTVPSAETILTYKKSGKTRKQIAQELGVKALGEVSWLQIESKHRLLYTLSDPFLNNRVIATGRLEREGEDIIFLQRELARVVVSAVKVAITPAEQALLAGGQKVKPEAYELFMKGFYAYHTSLDFDEGLKYFEQAIAVDPNYALAHAYMGALWMMMGANALIPEKEAYPKAREAIQKALDLDDRLAFAHSNYAWIKAIMDWDFAGAEREFQRSNDLAPGDYAVQSSYNIFLRIAGRFDEGIERQRKLRESTPRIPEDILSSLYLWSNRLAEGLVEAERSYQQNPTPTNKFWLAFAYRMNGRYTESLGLYKDLPDMPDTQLEIAILFALSRKREEALEQMEKVKALRAEKNTDPSFDLATFHAVLGEKDKAIEFLNQAFKNHLGVLINIKTYPDLRSLHGDPRFEELVKKMGFPEIPSRLLRSR